MSGLNAERTVTRTEAAEYLREFANKLASGDADVHGERRDAGEERRETGGDVTDDPSTGTNTTTDTATQGATEERGRDAETGHTPDQTDGTAHGYEKVTFLVGNDSATVNPPEELALDVEVGEDSSMMSSGAETVTFSLRWEKEAVPESNELRIE
jgi:hypothetical protein